MPILPSCISVLAVAVIFYIWRAWWRVKMRNLRERIAYMLWVSVQDPE